MRIRARPGRVIRRTKSEIKRFTIVVISGQPFLQPIHGSQNYNFIPIICLQNRLFLREMITLREVAI